MDRRRFVVGSLGAVACPSAAFAQTPARTPRICYLGNSTLVSTEQYVRAFLEGLREFGWTDGQNLRIDFRWGEGRLDLIEKIAAEVVRDNYGLIFASGQTGARALRMQSATIPIVSALLHDPVAEGFAKSWSRPGGNVTGVSTVNQDLLAKRVQIAREMVPTLKTLAVVYDPALPNLRHGFDDIAATASRMGFRAAAFELRTETDIEPVFARIKRERGEAVIVPAYPLTTVRRAAIAASASKHALPAIGETVEFAVAGGLASHGPDWVPLFRRAASHVDRILRGAKPGDLPIEQPTHYELVLNQKTASALGIRFPQTVLLRADRVIE